MKIRDRKSLCRAEPPESRIRQDFGVIIVAIRKAGGEMRFNPPGDAVLEGGDLLITLGPRDRLDRLDERASA